MSGRLNSPEQWQKSAVDLYGSVSDAASGKMLMFTLCCVRCPELCATSISIGFFLKRALFVMPSAWSTAGLGVVMSVHSFGSCDSYLTPHLVIEATVAMRYLKVPTKENWLTVLSRKRLLGSQAVLNTSVWVLGLLSTHSFLEDPSSAGVSGGLLSGTQTLRFIKR